VPPAGTRRRRLTLLAGVPAALVALYWGLGTLLAPALVQRAIERHDARTPGVEMQVEHVRVRPFRLRVELTGLHVRATDGSAALIAPRTELDWRPAARPWRRPRLTRLEVDAPHAIVELPPCCRHSELQRLAPALEAAFTRLAPWRPGILVASDGRLELIGGDDLIRRPRTLSDIQVRFHGLAADAGARYAVEFAEEAGWRLALDGLLAPEAGELRGRMRATRDFGPSDAESPPEVATGTFTASLGPGTATWTLRTRLELADAQTLGGPESLAAHLQYAPGTAALELEGLPASALTAFAARAFGRGLASGQVALTIEQRQVNGQYHGSVQVRARELSLAPGGTALPLELALALLEDADGRVALRAPLAVDAEDALGAALAQALRDELERLAAEPFATLGAAVGDSGERLERLEFVAGSADADAALEAALDRFAEALAARPRLAVVLPAAFHPVHDRHALAARQVELHVALATAEAAFRARPAALDFASARVREVLEEFAGERFGPDWLASVRARFEGEEETAYGRALFELLAASEPIADAALQRLAHFRGRALSQGLVTRGIAPARIAVGEATGDAEAGPERVVLRAELAPAAASGPPAVTMGAANRTRNGS
jgi:hypothetical protein